VSSSTATPSPSDRVILFHRKGDEEVIECLSSERGASLWTHRYATSYRDSFGFDPGPRATPAAADGRVYTFGAEGKLTCVDLETGDRRWQIDTRAKFGASSGYFGAASSPLVDGGLVVVQVGGTDGAGVVAFDAKTGETRWRATNDEAGYASPVAADLHGKRSIVCLTRRALVGLDASDGRVLFDEYFRARIDASVNAATPLVLRDLVFVSASYRTGAALFRWDGTRLASVWKRDEVLSNHYATSVLRDGHLYGFDGRQEGGATLRCVSLEKGEVEWSSSSIPCGTVTLVGDRLLVLDETGVLTLAEASPKEFRSLGKIRILQGTARAHPAIASGRLYARSEHELVCVDLSRR
jgi:outer membrane protein assembly factor BamB